MTSRSLPGPQEPLLSGGPHRVSSRGQPTPQHRTASGPVQHVVASASDGDKRARDGLSRQSQAVDSDGKLKAESGAARLQMKTHPRGKPQRYFGDGLLTENGNAAACTTMGTSVTSSTKTTPTAAPLDEIPFPSRPVAHPMTHRPRSGKDASSGNSANDKRGLFEPPPASLCFPTIHNSKPIDFFPWYGTHNEDTLNESLCKHGFSNNKNTNMNESTTAKPSISASVKNHHGLQNLSKLFVKVLETRQANGRLTTPTTFKPPPRASLTDKHRESWLKDLANPANPLRRLSRMIPHGISGKRLLEQCLAKRVPVARAVWFIKIVGANEMRSAKRKGTLATAGIDSELKWIKEWTVFVEQFIDSIINACGESSDWKENMDYTIRLSASLYSERLLDQEHYLNWLVASMEGSQADRLPIWLLFIHIYWRDLVGTRRRGSRMAETLLQHSSSISSDVGTDNQNPLTRRLDHLILSLLIAHRGCLIMPRIWKTYESTIRALASRVPDVGKSQVDACIQQMCRRNQRLRNGESTTPISSGSPAKSIIRLLDSLGHKIDVNIISAQCTSLIPDQQNLVALILKWACSYTRTGDHRIYLATRLLGKWNTMGFDTDNAILRFMKDAGPASPYDTRMLFRLVAELVRSKRFNVGKYLQWLIATGSTSVNVSLDQQVPCYIRLITEIPIGNLTEHTENLRQTLLHGMGYSTEDEEDRICDIQTALMEWIQHMSTSPQPPPINSHPSISQECLTVRCALSLDLRAEIADRVPIAAEFPLTARSTSVGGTYTGVEMSIMELCSIRQIMEQLQDFPVLADILELVIRSNEYPVLTSVVDTLNYHSRTFAAIGALVPLVSNLAKRYSILRSDRTPDKQFLRAFAELCTSIHVDPQLLQAIRYDLARLEQQYNMVVCSPASDNMTEMMQSTNMDTDDEIERILVSGNSMDEQIMGRVFKKMTVRLADQYKKDGLDLFTSWFPRLKAFDERTFERLAHEWLSGLLIEQQLPLLRISLPILVASKCLSVGEVAKQLSKVLTKLATHDGVSAARLSKELLDLVLPGDTLTTICRPQDAYRYRLEQRQFCREFIQAVLALTRQSIDLFSEHFPKEDAEELRKLLGSSRLLDFLKPVTIFNKKTLLDAFPYQATEANANKLTNVKYIFNKLLDPMNGLSLASTELADQVGLVIDAIDDLSLPFCQLQLQGIFCLDKVLSREGENGVELALLHAMKIAVDRNSSNVSDLVAGLGEGVTRKIREHTEGQILNAIPLVDKKGLRSLQQVEGPTEMTLRRYLAVVDSIPLAQDSGNDMSLLIALVEKLRVLSDCLSADDGASDPGSGEIDEERVSASIANICPWLEALLHLLVAHRPSLQMKGAPLASVLGLLRNLLTNVRLQKHLSITQYIFDVAALLSDDLPDDLRAAFAKAECSKPGASPHTNFIFGGPPTSDGWLGLVTPQAINATSAPAASSPSTTTSSPQGFSQQQPSARTRSPGVPPITQPMRSQTPQQRLVQQQQQQRQIAQQQQQQQHQQNQQNQQQQQTQQQRTAQQQRMAAQQSLFASFNQNNNNNFPTNNFSNWNSQFSPPVAGLPSQQSTSNQAFNNGAPLTPLTSHLASMGVVPRGAQTQTPTSSSTSGSASGQGQNQNISSADWKPVPYIPRRWELLPDPASNGLTNDTAISLGLFGARRVV